MKSPADRDPTRRKRPPSLRGVIAHNTNCLSCNGPTRLVRTPQGVKCRCVKGLSCPAAQAILRRVKGGE
jgi:hypothetical protein